MAGLLPDVTSETWKSEVLESAGYTLVDFWGEACPPCRFIAPILDELALAYEGDCRFVKVNADDNADLLAEFGISALPCLVLFRDGKEVERLFGQHSKSAFKAWLDEKLAG